MYYYFRIQSITILLSHYRMPEMLSDSMMRLFGAISLFSFQCYTSIILLYKKLFTFFERTRRYHLKNFRTMN